MATRNTTTTTRRNSMTTDTAEDRIPAPLYAAAGAGDLAYQQLRKIPSRVAELRDRVVELRPTVSDAVSERKLRADLKRVRTVAKRNAYAVVSGAQAAQDRALAVYNGLVTRGERVVRTVRVDAAAEISPIEVPATGYDNNGHADGVPAVKSAPRRTQRASK
jgi:heparin binding hemagglutinin HbhA